LQAEKIDRTAETNYGDGASNNRGVEISFATYREEGNTMKASGWVLTLATAFVLIPAVSGLAPAQQTESLASPPCDVIAVTRLLFYGDDPGDLGGCEQDCRSRFGYDYYSDTDRDNYTELQRFRGGGGAGSGTYYAYAQCIADCNSAFWKDFDRKSKDLEKE
jgi:hypothetical protein